jgi:hypothetical protein
MVGSEVVPTLAIATINDDDSNPVPGIQRQSTEDLIKNLESADV